RSRRFAPERASAPIEIETRRRSAAKPKRGIPGHAKTAVLPRQRSAQTDDRPVTRPSPGRNQTLSLRTRLRRLARVSGPVRIPEAEAAENRVLVVAAPAARWQLVELVDAAAAEHDLVRLDRGDEALDGLEDGTLPFLLAELLQAALADVVLERL